MTWRVPAPAAIAAGEGALRAAWEATGVHDLQAAAAGLGGVPTFQPAGPGTIWLARLGSRIPAMQPNNGASTRGPLGLPTTPPTAEANCSGKRAGVASPQEDVYGMAASLTEEKEDGRASSGQSAGK